MPSAGKTKRKKSTRKKSELGSALDQVGDESTAAAMKEFQDLLAQAKSDTRTRAHSESFAKQLMLSAEALHHFTQPIVRERFCAMIVAAGHGVVVDQGVHDCFFRSQHHAREERVHQIIGNCLDAMCDL